MLRQVACLALILSSVVAGSTRAVWAQSSGGPPSLGDRLEQFRDDLLGTSNQSASKTKKPTAASNNASPPQAQASQGKVGAKVAPLTTGAQTPALASKSRATPATGPSSRRTAQPTYKPAPIDPDDAPEAESKEFPLPVAELKQPAGAVEDFGAVEETSKPAKAQPMPMPRVVRQAPRRSATPASEGEAASKPETTGKPETASRSTHKTPAAVAPGGKDVLLTGRTPSLAIEATGPRKVMIGREAIFKISVQNVGEIPANNVKMSLDIPSGAEIVDVQTTAGTNQPISASEGATPLEWDIPRLASKGHETMTLKLVPHQNAPIDLSVHWACTPESSQMSVEVQEPKLAMSLSGPTEVLYGQSRSYKLIISNPGNGDAENVMVSLMPIGRAAEAAASHRLGTLAAGGSKAIEVELTARQAGELMIRAQAMADGGLTAEVAEQVLVRRANLQLDIEGPKVKFSGTKGVYRIHVINTGNAVAEDVHVAAVLPPQATYQSSNAGGRVEADKSKIVWSPVNMQPGEERLLEVQCLLQAPGENRLQVSSTASQELAASGTAVTVVESLADLKLEVRDPQGPISTGEDAIYEVVVRNRGTKGAENVNLVLFFSSGLEATAVQGGPHEIGPGQVVLKTIASLPAGSEKTFKVHARADRAGNHVFRAEVVCAPLDIKLTSEQSTRFYGDDASETSVPSIARRPANPETEPVQQ
ncbi:MAG TPA: hypothetical protein VHY91_11685 [Pirellulales bacterium]|jgi:uncharacterized repeat protein (TIGR01451 family)|nr:hypothetical protein [Pirellulales bacterium]